MEDRTDKFGDFFEDEIVECEPETLETPEGNYIPVVGSHYMPNEESEKEVNGAIDKLTEKFNLPLKNLSVKDVLANIDEINTDDSSFDLVASKIVTDYVSRVALRGVITEANMINKVFELMDRTTINDINGDSLLMVSKAFEYQDKLFQILDRYKKAGVNSSLKHIAENKDKDSKSEKITLTPDQIRKVVEEINRQKEEISTEQE